MLRAIVRSFLLAFLWAPFCPWAWAAPSALTYQGRIVQANGRPLEHSNVSFQFEITTPNGGCVLYREQVNGVNMANSNGVFDVKIGQSHSYPAAAGFSILDSFNNSLAMFCDGGASYNPVLSDGRLLRVQFHDGTAWRLISPDNVIRSVPFAGYSESAGKLGAYQASDFILKSQVNSGANCDSGSFLTWNAATDSFGCSVDGAGTGSVTDVTSANSYLSIANTSTTPLLTVNVGTTAGTVAAGNDSRFTNSRAPNGSAAGDLSGSYPAPTVAKIRGVGVEFSTAPSTGQVLTFDGTNWISSDVPSGNAGTVTSVIAGTGLTGGAISTSGTIGLGAELMGVNNLSSTGYVRRTGAGTYGTTSASTVASSNTLVQRDGFGVSGFNGVSLSDGASGLVTLQTAAISATYSLKLPDAQGGANQVMMNDGSGLLSWANVPSAPGAACGAGNVLTYNGTAFTCVPDQVGSAGGGIVSINSQTGSAQSFGNGTTGNAPGWSSASDVHTLHIPYARNTSVTAGLISKAEYDTFNGKQSALGFTPLDPANNLSELITTASTARNNLGLGTAATYQAATTTTAANGEVVLGNDTRLTNARPPSGSAGGDLSGTYPHPDVNRIKGIALLYTAIASGEFLKYNGTNWVNAALAVSDISGLSNSMAGKVDKSQISSCTAKQTLSYVSVSDTWSCANIGIDDSQITYASKTAKTFLAAPNGGAGTPTFRAIASTDLPVSVTDAFWSGSTDVYRLTGNVGVGTATPESAAGKVFHLHNSLNDGTTASNSAMIIQSANRTSSQILVSNVHGKIAFRNTSPTTLTGQGQIYYDAIAKYFSLTTDDTEKVRITATGNVGIGTNDPQYPLDILPPAGAKFIRLQDNDSTGELMLGDGTNGVNQFSPSLWLKPIGSTRSAGLTAQIIPADDTGTVPVINLSARVDGSTNIATRPVFAINNYTTRLLTLSPEGYLGLGTATPTGLLSLNGGGARDMLLDSWGAGGSIDALVPGSSAGALIQAATNAHLVFGLRDNDAADGFYFLSGGGNYNTDSIYDTSIMALRADGKVGIGTASPSAQFYVYDIAGPTLEIAAPGSATNGRTALNFTTLTGGTGLGTVGTKGWHWAGRSDGYTGSAGSPNDLLLYSYDGVTGTNRFTLQHSTGNVGIGTTAPASLLEVAASGAATAPSVATIDRLVVRGTGNTTVNITTPNSSSGGFYFSDPESRDPGGVIYNHATDSMMFRVDGATKLTVLSSGNVGIGTGAPGTLLHVNTATAGATVARFQSGTGSCNVVPNTGMSCSSDERLKEDIKWIPYALEKVNQVHGVTFKWKDRAPADESRHMGFIAQDIEKVAPELVSEDDKGFKQVNYANFVAVLNEGLKEFFRLWHEDSAVLHQKVELLTKELIHEKRRNDDLEKRLQALEQR